MDTAIRLWVSVLKPDQEPTQGMIDKATVHRFVHATGVTLCGKQIDEADKRWRVDRRGEEGSINCNRCRHKMGLPPSPASWAERGKQVAPAVKKPNKPKAARPKANGASRSIRPAPKPTSPPAKRRKERAETGELLNAWATPPAPYGDNEVDEQSQETGEPEVTNA